MSTLWSDDLVSCQFQSDLRTSKIFYANYREIKESIIQLFLKTKPNNINLLVSCPTEFGRGVTPSKIWIQLTQLSGNCVLHQHVVHYNSVSF